MNFSVVIPTCGRSADLEACLAAIEPQLTSGVLGSVEVIVSDDGRDEELAKNLREKFSFARYLVGPARGPAANRNHGAGHACGDWLIFCDDDCRPQPGWLAAYAKTTSKDNTPVLEGRTIADRPRQRLDEEAPINEIGGYLWSCNFAIRRELFVELGGFDEAFPFAAMEDVELKARLDSGMHAIRFVEEAVCVHPWRRLKGIEFQMQRLQSLKYLWRKHPTLRPEDPRYWLIFRALREIKNHVLPHFWRCRGRGFSSALGRALSFFIYAFRY